MMHTRSNKKAFTLVELLVVIGIIAIMIGILLPTLNKARKSAKQTVCLSNLRQMGVAWNMYLTDYKGHLPYYIWHQQPTGYSTSQWESFVWHGYWMGILSDYRLQSGQLLCPEALEPVSFNQNKGFGTAFNAWSGQWQSTSPVGIYIDKPGGLNNTNDATKKGYRVGSYEFNRNVTSHDKDTTYFGYNINEVKPQGEVPIFFDSVWVDGNSFPNGSATSPAPAPPDLYGNGAANTSGNDHWRFLIARHGHGINMCFSDGHAQWTQLEETFQLRWKNKWTKYSLTNLPKQ